MYLRAQTDFTDVIPALFMGLPFEGRASMGMSSVSISVTVPSSEVTASL